MCIINRQSTASGASSLQRLREDDEESWYCSSEYSSSLASKHARRLSRVASSCGERRGASELPLRM